MHWRRKWQPTPVFLPGESQGREAWRAAVYGVTQSRTRLKRLSSSSSISNLPLSLSFLTCKGDNATYFSSLKNNVIPQTPINLVQQAASSEPQGRPPYFIHA